MQSDEQSKDVKGSSRGALGGEGFEREGGTGVQMGEAKGWVVYDEMFRSV